MPHDKNGAELKVGDKVTVEFTVESISPGTDYCNVTLKSVEGRKPDGMKECLTGNAAVCVKVILLLLALFGWVNPAAAQDKEFVLDTRTGQVSQKDIAQDKEIAALKAEVAALKAKLAPAAAGVAALPDPFAVLAPCPCGDSCPCVATKGTPAPGVVTRPTPPTFNSEVDPFAAPTSTGVRYAVSGGITSGCASGNCAAPSFRPVRRLFGR